MISLCYVSSSTKRLGDDEILALLQQAQANNRALDISGLLLYNGQGTFIQVLEGDEDRVKPLYETIKKDPRHRRVNLLAERKITERSFAQWQMGYRNLSHLSSTDKPHFSHFMQQENPEKFLESHSDFAYTMLLHFKHATQELVI